MFSVTVVPQSLKVDSREFLYVAGRVWLTISDVDFPGRDWSDSPLSVIGSLGTAVRDYMADGIGEMYFFGGPFLGRLTPDPLNDSLVVVSGIGARPPFAGSLEIEERVQAQASVPLREVLGTYQASLRDLTEWASRNKEVEILSVILRMERFADY